MHCLLNTPGDSGFPALHLASVPGRAGSGGQRKRAGKEGQVLALGGWAELHWNGKTHVVGNFCYTAEVASAITEILYKQNVLRLSLKVLDNCVCERRQF